MDIRCRKTECEFNDRYTCKANAITVSEKTLCTEYKKTDKKEPDTSKTLLEREPNYAPYRDRNDLCIDCRAMCMFNDNKKCRANGITVNVSKEKPLCVTYIKK